MISGMIVLREAIKEKKGNELLERLGDVWTSFYKNILPMLLAIFYPIQEQGTTIRAVTLIGFRDMVLLKTKIADALEPGSKASPEIKQMLLVLASVHDGPPPSDNYLRLEQLVARVISPYLGSKGLHTPQMSMSKRNSIDQKSSNGNGSLRERKLSISKVLKEEVTRKFRRSGSLTGQTNNTETNNNTSFKRRFKIGDNPPVQSQAVVPPVVKTSLANDSSIEISKASEDSDMLAYLEERKQRWKNRDEMLGSESLLE